MIKSDIKTFKDMLSSTKNDGLRLPNNVHNNLLVKKSGSVRCKKGDIIVHAKVQLQSNTYVYYIFKRTSNNPEYFKFIKIDQK